MRVLNRTASAVLALALLAGGLVAAVEILSAFLGREEPLVLPWDRWYEDARATPWSDPDLRLLFVVLLAVGVLLLVMEAVSRRPTAVPLESDDGKGRAELDRRGLERWLGKQLEGVDGVAGARARVRRRGALVDAESTGRDTGRVRDELRVAAGEALDRLSLERTMPVKVNVRSRRET